jgi:hypothetical protein
MHKPAFLCIASYFKGNDFLRGMKAAGATVYLLTSQKHSDKAWAREALDDIFYIQQNPDNEWNMEDAATGLAWLMRKKRLTVSCRSTILMWKKALSPRAFPDSGYGPNDRPALPRQAGHAYRSAGCRYSGARFHPIV